MPLHTICSVDHQDRIIQHLQGTLHLSRKIHMPRCIQKCHLAVTKLKHCLLGKNRNPPLSFQRVVIKERIPMIYTPRLTDLSCQIKDSF